ncbi:hypothetical protein CBF45_07420 [Bordetella sp. J329]|nr:hypothetical protein CBF45_07420 [Bordetella sp. J329]
MKPAEFLAEVMRLHGDNANSLAAKSGATQSTLHRFITGDTKEPRKDFLGKLARVYSMPVDVFFSESVRDEWAARFGLIASAERENISPGPDLRGNVPLISSVQAGEWTEIASTFRAQDAELWLPCPVKHGPRTFCLRVEGESMKNPGSKPSYDPGDIIFVDPDVCAVPGNRVVVKLDDQDKATFKQYMEEDGRKMLKALNPDWKPRYIEINGNASLCGVVIGKWVAE